MCKDHFCNSQSSATIPYKTNRLYSSKQIVCKWNPHVYIHRRISSLLCEQRRSALRGTISHRAEIVSAVARDTLEWQCANSIRTSQYSFAVFFSGDSGQKIKVILLLAEKLPAAPYHWKCLSRYETKIDYVSPSRSFHFIALRRSLHAYEFRIEILSPNIMQPFVKPVSSCKLTICTALMLSALHHWPMQRL